MVNYDRPYVTSDNILEGLANIPEYYRNVILQVFKVSELKDAYNIKGQSDKLLKNLLDTMYTYMITYYAMLELDKQLLAENHPAHKGDK